MNRDSRRVRLVLTLLVLVSLTLLGLDYRDGRGGAFRTARTLAGDVFGPVERAVAEVVDPIGRFFASLAHLGRYQAQAQRLARENQALRDELDSAALSRAEARQLAALELLAGVQQDRILPARVIGAGGLLTGLDYVVQLDVGADDGVALGQTVIAGDGLVGSVVEVSPLTSDVLEAIDPSATIGARLAGNEEIGTIVGHGFADLTFTPEDPADHPRVGEKVVTLGPSYPGDLYAADIEIGTVRSVFPGADGTIEANVVASVSFASLGVVGVIVHQPRTNKLGPITPPQPRVTVTATVTVRPTRTAAASPGASPSGSSPSASPTSPAASPTPTPSG